jgi:hypothetical protein
MINHRARRRRALVAVLAIGATLGLAACFPPPPEALPPQVSQYCVGAPPTSAAGYQQAFDGLRTVWTEWAAADGGLPTALPDGRVLWTFGDTLVGRVRPNASVADPSYWVRNSFVLQTGGCFTPIMGGPRGARSEVIPNPAGNEWYWPSDAVAEGSQLRVFSLHVRTAQSGVPGFDFQVLGTSVSTFSLPGLQLLGTANLPVPTAAPADPLYGQTVVSDGTYLYAYGPRDIPFSQDPYFPVKEHRIARVPLGQETTGPWEFALIDQTSGLATGWTSVAASAAPMVFDGDIHVQKGPRAPLAVIPDPAGGYLASAMPLDGFAGQVDTWHASAPTGPWTHVGTAVAGLPAAFGTTWAYGGRVVKLPASARMVLWSQNHNPLSDIIANNNWYKVGFAPA